MMCGGLGGRKEGRKEGWKKERKKERGQKVPEFCLGIDTDSMCQVQHFYGIQCLKTD